MNGGGELEVGMGGDPLGGHRGLDGSPHGHRRRAHGSVGVVAGEGHVAGGAAGRRGPPLGIRRGRGRADTVAAAIVVAEDGVDAEGQLGLLDGFLLADGCGLFHFLFVRS